MCSKNFVRFAIVGIFFFSLGLFPVSADGGPSFVAGDGRLDPRVGDRLAVYVKTSEIEVWGIDNQSNGSRLATISVHDLMGVGKGVVTKELGAMGKVTLQSLGNGKYVIGWVGGPFGATGQGAFAKTFSRVPLNDADPGWNARLALYLKPKTVDVWGIEPGDKGIWLARFSLDEMKAAWGTTVERALDNGHGTITLTGNGNGYYMVSWKASKFGATGEGVYHICFNYAAFELPKE